MVLHIGVFSLNTPLLIASSNRWFEANDVEVHFHHVTSSEHQFRELADGNFDVVLTAFDNVLNYAANDATAVGGSLDLVVLRPVDRGMNLAIVGAPGIGSVDDIRGRTFGVDAPDSGFAYLAYEALSSAGLEQDKDYSLVRLGGVKLRFDAILSDGCSATLLSNGFEQLAHRSGLHVLAPARELRQPYLGAVFSCLSTVSEAKAPEIARFLEVYERGVLATLDREYDSMIAHQLAESRNIDIDTALDLIGAERGMFGLLVHAGVDPQAALSTAQLRAAYEGFPPGTDVDFLTRSLMATSPA